MLFFQGMALASGNVQDPNELLPDDIKDEDAIDIVKFLLNNIGVIVATVIILVALLRGASDALNALEEYRKNRDAKELMGTLTMTVVTILIAVLLGYIAQKLAGSIS
jgi:ABC-type phosphate transport system permease subunit